MGFFIHQGVVVGFFILAMLISPIVAETRRRRRRRRLVFQEEYALNPNLSVAVFGDGSAYGSGLEDRFDAFPYLLSPLTTNYANPGTNNLNYFSTCTESSLGETTLYDIIVLDYYLRYNDGLEDLVRKLRYRFPNALILMLKSWSPSQFRRRENELTTHSMSFKQWKDAQGFGPTTPLGNIISALRADTGHWYYPARPHADRVFDYIAKKYNGNEISLHFEDAGGRETLINFMGFFDDENHTRLSLLGHEAIARSIQNRFNGYYPDPQVLIDRRSVGSWGKGDNCNLWYDTGVIKTQYSRTFVLKEDRMARYGLELITAGWVSIINPFRDGRHLYLTFKTSRTEGTYPKIVVEWSGGHKHEINPLSTDPVDNPTKTVDAGLMLPGVHQVNFQQLEFGTTEFFTLVGFSFSDERAAPMEYGFGLTYDSATDLREAANAA